MLAITDPSDLHRGHRSTFHVKFDDFCYQFRHKTPILGAGKLKSLDSSPDLGAD